MSSAGVQMGLGGGGGGGGGVDWTAAGRRHTLRVADAAFRRAVRVRRRATWPRAMRVISIAAEERTWHE